MTLFHFFLALFYLIVGEDPVDVNLSIRSKSQALLARSNDASDKSPVAQAIVQRLLVRPIRPLLDLLEMGVVLGEPRVEHCHFDPDPGDTELPQRVGFQDGRDLLDVRGRAEQLALTSG